MICDAQKGDFMKRRHYTLQQMGDGLCLTIKGRFLTQEFGLQAGDYFQLVHQEGQLILLKQTKEEPTPSASTLVGDSKSRSSLPT